MKSLKNVAGFGRRTLSSSLALLSVVGAIGRAGLRKEVELLRCSGVKVMCQRHGVPEMVTPAMRTTSVLLCFLRGQQQFLFGFLRGQQQFCSFFKRTTAVLLGFLRGQQQFCSVFLRGQQQFCSVF